MKQGGPRGASSQVVQVRGCTSEWGPPRRATPAGRQPGLPLSGFTVRGFLDSPRDVKGIVNSTGHCEHTATCLHCFLHQINPGGVPTRQGPRGPSVCPCRAPSPVLASRKGPVLMRLKPLGVLHLLVSGSLLSLLRTLHAHGASQTG